MKIKSQVVACGKAFLFSTLHVLGGLISWVWHRRFPKTGLKLPQREFGIVITKTSPGKGVIYHARRAMDKMLDNLRGLP
jgi:hypothetical protein